MLDPRADSIIYQSQVKFASLVDSCITGKRNGKDKDALWNKILLIRRYLKALEFRDHLDDINQANYILEQLIDLTGINDFPAAPTLLLQNLPSILVGLPGAQGIQGPTGAVGQTGLATDFSLPNSSVTSIVDTFTIASAKGAKWDYVVVSSSLDQRTGTVAATWKADGSSVVFTDYSTPDIGATTGIEFNVLYSGGSIQLQAVISSGVWTVTGTRYFTPNNGNGSGPISNALPLGQVYIGNASNQAAPQSVSGAITIGTTGVVTISNGVILDTNISATAAINLTKLATLPVNQLVVTNTSGFLATVAVTPVEAGYLTGVTSNIQAQLNTKLSGSAGAISTVTSTNLTNNRAVISNNLGKIDVSNTTDTELSYLSGASSSIQTQLNGKQPLISGSIVTAPAGNIVYVKVIPLGDWNMDLTLSILVNHGLPTIDKIRSMSVTIRDDNDTLLFPLPVFSGLQTLPDASVFSINSTAVNITRAGGGYFDNTTYDSTSYNRGWLTIFYEA